MVKFPSAGAGEPYSFMSPAILVVEIHPKPELFVKASFVFLSFFLRFCFVLPGSDLYETINLYACGTAHPYKYKKDFVKRRCIIWNKEEEISNEQLIPIK